jgi:pimeloyl-ACP methyl ester carboxylesterase
MTMPRTRSAYIFRAVVLIVGVVLHPLGGASAATAMGDPQAEELIVFSSIDGTNQPCLFVRAPATGKRPLLVLLHTWSSTYRDFAHMAEWQAEAKKRNWHCLQPNYRGPNTNPEACASIKARQDILDAVEFVLKNYAVDETKIYLAGASGGGHMALVMAAHAPERWSAVTAWCPITDLAAWHAECTAAGLKYAADIEACCGGPPGVSPEVDKEYQFRSPIHGLAAAVNVPIDISTGIHDGHQGSVPIHHALDAFNVLARAAGEAAIDAATLEKLAQQEPPLVAGAFEDAAYGRAIHFRRTAGSARLTVFEGGHEALPGTASVWLTRVGGG